MRDLVFDAACELEVLLRKHITVPSHVTWEWAFQPFDQSFVIAACLRNDKEIFRNTKVYVHDIVRKPESVAPQIQSMIDELPSGLDTEW